VNVPEHKLMTARKCDQYTAQGLPVWEVQGCGTVTGAGHQDTRPPWIDVRLTLADGARIDVLAVLRGDRIAIEDAQADPPLTLEGLASLAEAIGAPLLQACESVTGVAAPPPYVPGAARVPAEGGPGGNPHFVAAEPTDTDRPVEWPAPETGVTEPARVPESGGIARPADAHEPSGADEPAGADESGGIAQPAGATDPDGAAESTGAIERDVGGEAPCVPEPDASTDAVRPAEGRFAAPGRHRAAVRGAAGRRNVAAVYLAAQQAGHDPVLAVMAATGLSRRRSLRLIAGARDKGNLPSSRHRR
jgi:hypothetical protein